MRKTYFLYELRAHKVLYAFLYVSELAFMLVPLVSGWSSHEDLEIGLSIGYLLSLGLTLLLPMLSLSFVHKKSSVDAFFSLPVGRKEQIVTILSTSYGFIACSYLLNSLLLALFTGFRDLHPASFLLGLLVALLTLAALTVIHGVLYLLGNSIFDGIVMVGGYCLLPLAVYLVTRMLDQNVAGWDPLTENLVAFYLSPAFMAVALTIGTFANGFDVGEPIIMAALLTLFTLAALYGYKREFIDRETERAEQISDKPYAYPFLIHFVTFCALLATVHESMRGHWQDYVIVYVLLAFLYVVAQFVYQRKLGITPRMLAFFLATVAAAGVFSWVIQSSHGFNLSQAYDHSPKEIEASLHIGGDIETEKGYIWYTGTVNLKDPARIEELRQEAIRLYYDRNAEGQHYLRITQDGRDYGYYLGSMDSAALGRYCAMGAFQGYYYDEEGNYHDLTPGELRALLQEAEAGDRWIHWD